MAGRGKRPDQDTKPCPECKGAMVVPGARYTEPERPCPTCGGSGVVPVRTTKVDSIELTHVALTEDGPAVAGKVKRGS